MRVFDKNETVENAVVKKDMDVVVKELERNLKLLEMNYQKALSNLSWLKECVETDDLTRLMRRNAFLLKLHDLLTESSSNGKPVHIMMIDVDHFKKVNDTYGHPTGDVVLERVSSLVKQFLSPQDLACRYGGEEIIVAMQAERHQALEIAENIRRAVENNRMEAKETGAVFNVTLSAGLASSKDHGYDTEKLIARADEALYAAKHNGRNQVQESRKVVQLQLVEAKAAA